MKTLKLLSVVVLLSISFLQTTAQTQFDYLGGLGMSANGTGCFFIDLNTGNTNLGINDVKFVHTGGEIYFDAVAGDSLRLPYRTTRLGYKLWQDCGTTNAFTENRVYVIKGIQNIGVGSHVLPFKYNNLYNYIVLRVTPDSVYIRGWVFNIPENLYECYQLTSLQGDDPNQPVIDRPKRIEK